MFGLSHDFWARALLVAVIADILVYWLIGLAKWLAKIMGAHDEAP